ncbi:hypothetical protein H2200_003548 [Cladophialophora chaetospira]|uniref:Wings apart-like protein C-terminal domain-containing protein n=1 Tax=Cladophialophora chaetospira TaxID=386627 RepID=A0AA38XEE5_9EURO|nr:hypothetical protein H2200_003548 [Cladophialophora chaetospira]
MMEFPVVRRKVNTYGKGVRKIRVHDLFDVGTQPPVEPTTTTIEQHAATPLRHAGAPSITRREAEDEVKSTMAYETDGTKETVTATSSPSLVPHDSSDTFDIHSSEEDAGILKPKRPLKKRKTLSEKPSRTADVDGTTKSKAVALKPSAPQKLGKADKSKMLQAKSANARAVAANSNLVMSPPALKRPVKATTKTTTTLASSSGPASPGGAAAVIRNFRSKVQRVSSVSSADLSDASHHSHMSLPSTPKRKRGVSDEGLPSPTPSDLHLTSLRLTPGSQRSQISSEDEEMFDAPVPSVRKGRARLIDRLDAPRTHSSDNSIRIATLQRKTEQSLSQPAITHSLPPSASSPRRDPEPAHERPAPNASIPPSGRPRATYAKQRSYLSDMVDNLDSGLPTSNSQTSSQQNYSQAASFASISSQVEMDMDDSDEPEAISQIKSIHELRRGGAVRKFDLELQTILEDIESASKSLRITGLLQLADKLHENTFLRHFQDSGNFQRLIDCVNKELDEVSATLLALVLQSVISTESSSPRVLLLALDALYRLPSRLISEARSLSRLARDRSQNISKLLVKDIADFESKRVKVLGHPSLAIDRTYLCALESCQRKLIGLKEPVPKMPRTVLDEIVSAFTETEDGAADSAAPLSHIETIRLLLSLLEIACANHELAGSSLLTSRIHQLGQTVSGVMRAARQAHPEMEHSCLRLIVSLSNNDAAVCGALSQGSLISTVFEVIDDHFLTLAGLAALEKDFNNARLESVILAVGCLLNLAECADDAREKMLARDSNGKSLTHQLVDIFNNHVDQANEALTMDQTQILVAFGYISALLCTLCMNHVARKRISKHIKGDGLTQLFIAADTFLQHLRTVEAALGDEEGSSTAFTARFTAVLETVKQQNV